MAAGRKAAKLEVEKPDEDRTADAAFCRYREPSHGGFPSRANRAEPAITCETVRAYGKF
jgi:hypothetical protein